MYLLIKQRELVRSCIQRLRADERGQTMIEYALIAFLVAIAAIVLLANVGVDLEEVFNKIEDALGFSQSATTPAGDNDAAVTP